MRKLANLRLRDAEVLLSERRYDGAYYLAGYAVECGLKACIAKQTRRGDFPDKTRAQKVFTHDLDDLLALAGLRPQLDIDGRTDPDLELNWAIAKDWDEQRRYTRSTKTEANDILDAISDPAHGVMPWIRKRW